MWEVNNNNFNLQMTEGDFGIDLPIKIKGATLSSGDSIKLIFKIKKDDTEPLIEKTYNNIELNTFNLSFTQLESQKFSIGNYVYSMDWYKDGYFMCNIIRHGILKVVDKS